MDASNFKKKVLGNGMTILFEKRNFPVVSVAFAVRSGGAYESEKEKGIHHFIEHMLYKGTKNRTNKQIAEEIEKNGGELNGFTDQLITAYWCKMPSEHLNIVLDVLSDLIKNPLFDEKEIEKERQVIIEEMKMRKDSPITYVFDNLEKCLFEPPLSINLIGTFDSLSSIDKKKLISKFKEVYSPENLILVVVGNANFDEIVKFAEANFSFMGKKIGGLKVKKRNESFVEKRKGIDQANLVFCYHIPENLSYSARLLNTLMAQGMSSRLFLEIREKRNLAYSVKGEVEINKYFPHGFIYVGTMKEKVDEVKKIIVKEFEKLLEDLSEKELAQVKEQLIGNYILETEDSQAQMLNLLSWEIVSKAEDAYEFEKKIKEVRVEDVKKLVKQILKEHNFFELLPY